ncbi:hypothetical protein SBOR_4454 [Sclerotinia borealis F-4128]|uniref:Uncharacterized protein n=1 Tax=Sclerotinia borealis (strain F-4128) TaxID=1432307 RepID=W9CKF9_SCLBF|nr:hypothetical protein SBOR_4454 [Sclerotinia borealis F-4128]
MASNVILCCVATQAPREHLSILLSVFLTALEARIRLNKPFSFPAGGTPRESEPIIELQEIKKDDTMQPEYNSRYFMLTGNLKENRAYIEMYPGESFVELKLEAVERWKMKYELWWSMDNITDERVKWRCSSCKCSYTVRTLREAKVECK